MNEFIKPSHHTPGPGGIASVHPGRKGIRALIYLDKGLPLRVVPGCALDFGLSRVSGRSIARERYLNRRLRPIDPYGTGFQKSTLHNLDVIPNRPTDTTFST